MGVKVSTVKSLKELAELVGGECLGPPDLALKNIAAIDQAGPEEITFVARGKYAKLIATSRAGAFIVGPELRDLERPRIVTADPYLAYAKIAAVFAPPPWRWPGISNLAYIGPDCQWGEEVSIAPFVYLGEGVRLGDRVTLLPGVVVGNRVTIGADTFIHPNVTIRDDCDIGSRVIIHSGTVIGSDGFGFAPEGRSFRKIPQLGRVVIEDEVEIGANCTIDRAALGETRIGRGVKIDNLVQVAHNVTIGADSIVVAQVGISGSTQIGRNVVLAGQVGLVGHIQIGDGVRVGAQSGVTASIPPGETYLGTPARPAAEFKRQLVVQHKLPEVYQRLRELEKQVAALTAALAKESTA